MMLEVVAVALFGDIVQRTPTRVGHPYKSYDKSNNKQSHHTVGSQRETLAVLSIDKGEHESPYGREASHDEEHQSLGAGTELRWEQLRPPKGVEHLYGTAVVQSP